MASDAAKEKIRLLLLPSETALDVFTRCKTDPLMCPIPGLEMLHPGAPIEILGASPSGKTEIALLVMLRCILPSWCGGEEKRVFYLDNDFHLNLKRIVSLISYQYQLHEENADSSLEKVVRDSLERLIIYKCNDHYQFYETLRVIEEILRTFSGKESPYKLLVMDSVSAFHWNQRIEDVVGITVKEVAAVIQSISGLGNIIILVLGWKGGKDALKVNPSTKIVLDFVGFKENTMVSKVLFSSVRKEISPCFLYVGAEGCIFTPMSLGE